MYYKNESVKANIGLFYINLKSASILPKKSSCSLELMMVFPASGIACRVYTLHLEVIHWGGVLSVKHPIPLRRPRDEIIHTY